MNAYENCCRQNHSAQIAQERLGVMQLTDTLELGGLERVAVNLANALDSQGYRSHLCTTRRAGKLASSIAPGVGQLHLQRRNRFDPQAIRRLVSHVRENHIQILHAHGTSLFVAALASLFPPHPSVIWHVHAGRIASHSRPMTALRLLSRRSNAVITVSEPLRNYCVEQLGLASSQVWYIPNLVSVPDRILPASDLPGETGSRIVCVANLLPDKDIENLLDAMKLVAREHATAHLLLVGRDGPPAYMQKIEAELQDPILKGRVSKLGVRTDVPAILKASDIGVLASRNEGMPVALIEYGLAGLASVATRVGQCEEVLNFGKAGFLVSPAAPGALGRALLLLLSSAERRQAYASKLHQHVQQSYSPGRILEQLAKIYAAAANQSASTRLTPRPDSEPLHTR